MAVLRFFCKFPIFTLVWAIFMAQVMNAHADDEVQYTENLRIITPPDSSQATGNFHIDGRLSPSEFNPDSINKLTPVAFYIGRWTFNKTMGEATFFDPKLREATFSFKSFSSGKKVRWLTISLKWDLNCISFCIEGNTTEFLPSPLAGDFLIDETGPIAASTIGSFRIGEQYRTFQLQLEGKISEEEKNRNVLKKVKITAEGTWERWTNNNLSLFSTSMSNKGLCIEDRSAALPPSGNYPMIPNDTFPSVWPETAFPIENIRVFSYSLGTAPARQWVLWAIQHNIKVLIGINLQNYTDDLANLSADYLSADPYLRSCFDRNVLAYAIGNEANTPEIPDMLKGIQATKNLIGLGSIPKAPVSTVLNLNDQWIVNAFPPENAEFTNDFKTLLPSLDILMFNTYGGYFIYEPVLLQPSLSWTSNGQVFSVLLNQFGSIRSAALKANVSSKPLWICETGWSSAPLSNHPEPKGWSSPTHLKTFYRNFLTFDQSTPFFPQLAGRQVKPPEMIFFFGLRDSFLPLLNVEEFFGLYKSSPTLIQKDL